MHDSVRPCLRSSDVRTLLESMESEKVDGVILGSPCVDTVKQVKSKNQMILIMFIYAMPYVKEKLVDYTIYILTVTL